MATTIIRCPRCNRIVDAIDDRNSIRERTETAHHPCYQCVETERARKAAGQARAGGRPNR